MNNRLNNHQNDDCQKDQYPLHDCHYPFSKKPIPNVYAYLLLDCRDCQCVCRGLSEKGLLEREPSGGSIYGYC